MALDVGTQLGSYEIVERIGAGGMGEVYRATDLKLGRDVAIKTLPAALSGDQDRLARFEREARLLATLNQPHIAAVYSLDEHEGTRFIAMELVEGETLEERLKAGPIPVEAALRFGLQIAEALEAAHEKGVVHRDLKPANIMINRDGQVKVLDFGLAKAFAGDPNAASPAHSPALSLAMTQQGLILGTAGYMSPEQASGQATDQRADVWAFGVVMYEMLTGLPLFSGESVPHILAAVLQRDPDWNRLPKHLHPRLKLLLERCLEKRVRYRYSGIADARVDIENILGDSRGVVVTPEAAAPAATGSLGRRIAASLVLVAVGVAGAGAAAWTLWPEPAPIRRLVYPVPEAHTLRNFGWSIMALAPDASSFVYNTTDGLYVRSMDELAARRIPGTEEQLAGPFFSPDGQSVAYINQGGQLKRVALTGGAAVVIASGLNNLFGASWGADGTILFSQRGGIFRVPATGGTPELVIAAEPGERFFGPRLLPDGDSVLFSSTRTQNWDEAQIAVQSLATGERTGLLSGGTDARYVSTGHIVYALGNGLFAVPFDAATLTVSGGPVSLVEGIGRSALSVTGAANFEVADDGTLVYVRGGGANQLAGLKPVWVDHDGREDPLGPDTCTCASPSLSPDGTRLAYDTPVVDQSDADIWVWSLTQGTNTRLTFEPNFQLGAVWSPDSTRIAYTSLAEGLFVRPADGTGRPEALLEASGTAVAWAWSAEDELIVTEGGDISLIGLDGDRERRTLLDTGFDEYRPALSPDRRWLAYESDESGEYEIYVRPFPDVDSGKWQVSSGGGREPKWSGDGRSLFYLGSERLMQTTVGDGTAFSFSTPAALFTLAPYLMNPLPPRRYDVSPDGERFVLVRQDLGTDDEAQTTLVVVTNWVDELRQRVPTG